MTQTAGGRLPGPVAIGGVGGSGTRVVAQILDGLGYHIGEDLNFAADNRWFTLLLKRPKWYLARRRPERDVATAAGIFEKAMLGNPTFDARERLFLARATADIALRGHDEDSRAGRGAWALRRRRSLRGARGPAPGRIGWGWKEPNTHVFLEHLVETMPELRYVHVLRDGVDMALSGNYRQLRHWHSLYGVDGPTRDEDAPRAALRYWLRANERAIRIGRERLGDRFLVIELSDLCADPGGAIRRLAALAGAEPTEDDVARLSSLVDPEAAGRGRRFAPVGTLDPVEVAAARRLIAELPAADTAAATA